MDNKYNIINWNRNNDNPPIYDVIMALINELNESLNTAMMKESKSDEEVQKILDNPAGIKIKELQVINTWGLSEELRIEVRNKLDWAYRYLSAESSRLIATRNDMSKSQEKSDSIDNENRKLKNIIVDRYKEIEKLVEDYGKKEELSEKERLELVYIRKVYSKALSKTIELLFSTAAENTNRARMFPSKEQQELLGKIRKLREEIRSLTRKSKWNQKNQQKENYEKLELEKKGLENKLKFLVALKNVLNSSFPNLIDSESKVNEGVLNNIIGDLNKLKQLQQQLPSEEGGIIKKTIQPKVDEENQIIKKVTEVIKEIENKTSQKLERVETRSLVEETKESLEKIVGELQKKVDLRNLSKQEGEINIEYQNQQIQLPKK